ncbi:DNA polymerase IV [Caldibacillus lycopersici]|uniref:DNA polymerase IV n=1 Tax=Perspicuibacillus lycopersici TaxID=1325689 RepID=A0AAE3IUT9_9BACI|nr:DNA polymerase IV [Perspicuibacillus lycopersici]MCU9613804.1 DNA polymerase IV [Perspicuibacillus lycopersici]
MDGNLSNKAKIIFHVDMNSFYASVEMASDATLKGKPVAIAGNVEERRGIIVTCSYEAREFGVKTTMPVWQAKKLCPHLIVKQPNFELYRKASKAMFQLLRGYTDLVEPVSIDEGYMDMTHALSEHPLHIANMIQEQLLRELDLPCSIGIAPNKFLAKMASDMKKPLGITILRKREIPTILWPMPVHEMHGVGKKTAEKLQTIGVVTIGDLASTNELQLKSLLGINGIRLKERANGIDTRPVDPESIHDYKSIGNSTTLPKDTTIQQDLLETLLSLSKTVSARLKNKNVYATNLAITIRYKDRSTYSRSEKLANPMQTEKDIYEQAKRLFIKHWNGNPVRLLGVTGNDLVEQDHAFKQLDIFTYEKDAKEEPLIKTMEKLRDKFGKDIIVKGWNNYHKEGQTDTGFNKDFLRREDE